MYKEISDYNNPQEVPGLSLQESQIRRFHDCLNEQLELFRGKENDDLYSTAVLEALAEGCNKSGLPQEFAVRMAGFQSSFGWTENLIKTVFHTAYLHKYLKTIPLKYMRPSALLTFKTEAYLREHYLLRMNVMTGVPEYKHLGVAYSFAPLDQKARNTMSINALKAGVDSWDKDINRFIDSDLIKMYEPLADYLSHLPSWDGKDRIGALARRVKTSDKNWEHSFHVWMLSMVAQWMGKNKQHGNAIVPLLIGPQGSGKTTFCRRLLPETLQMYFNDRLSMKNDNDICMAMSSFALINLDEFDSLSKRQQPILKYLLSKHDVKMRPPYGKAIEQRKRYASFIATTNNQRPLVDPSGSRRFVCVYADVIDNSGRINHNQIYAQLVAELEGGKRYWLTEAENKRLMMENVRYQHVGDYETMLKLTFKTPTETPEDIPFMMVSEIREILAERFPDMTINNNTSKNIGCALRAMGYTAKRMSSGMAYRILPFTYIPNVTH